MRANTGRLGLLAAVAAAIGSAASAGHERQFARQQSYYDPAPCSRSKRFRESYRGQVGGKHADRFGFDKQQEQDRRERQIEAGTLQPTPARWNDALADVGSITIDL